MLVVDAVRLVLHRNWGPIKVTPELDTRQLEERRGEVDVRRRRRLHRTSVDAWPSHKKGDADVLIETTLLTGR